MDVKSWKKDVLIPAVFERADLAFPELNFSLKGGVWQSPYTLKGEKRQRADKSYISPRYGAAIREQGGDSISFCDYVMEREGCDLLTAEKILADRLGLSFPQDYNSDYHTQQKADAERDRANSIFTKSLFSGTPEADRVLDYMRRRGWSDEAIRDAEIGYIDEAIKSRISIDLMGYVGKTHRLTIPYRHRGEIIGFKFRNIDHTATDIVGKYLNSKGLTKQGNLFGLPYKATSTNLVIVEGEFDALHAIALGATDIVATAGGALSSEAIKTAQKVGYTNFILLMDNDEAGRKFVEASIKAIKSVGGMAYVAELSGGKDLDEYLKTHNIDDYRALIAQSSKSCIWECDRVVERYSLDMLCNGELNDLQINSMLNEIAGIYAKSPLSDKEAIERYIIKNSETLLFPLQSLKKCSDEYLYREQQEKRLESLKIDLRGISVDINNGNIEKALKKMREISHNRQAEGKDFAEEFAVPDKSLLSLIGDVKEGIPTGYKFIGWSAGTGKQEEPLTLNVGLTFIVAPTSHGKTSFLNNIALNVAEWCRYTGNGKSILYFSYEIDKPRLFANFLNTYVNDAGLSKIGKPLNAIYDYARGNGKRFFTDVNINTIEAISHYSNFEKKYREFEDVIKNGAICISETAHKAGDLADAIRYYCKDKTPAIVCIDYAQLIYLEDNKGYSRTEELKEIVSILKELSKELQIPIVLSAQAKNDVRTPIDVAIENIGESKDLAMIADTVVGIFNLSRLHPTVTKNDKMAINKINRLIPDFNKQQKDIKELRGEKPIVLTELAELAPIHGVIYAKILKRRAGISDIETLLEWEGKTGKIELNDMDSLNPQPEQAFFYFGEPEEDAPY